MTPRPPGSPASAAFSAAALTVLAVLVAAHPAIGGATSPPWLGEAAAAALSPAQASAPAVVLLDERTVTVSPDGDTSTRHIYAVKVNTREGRHAAVLSESYWTDGGKVRQARGWIIRPSGEVRDIEKNTVLDMTLAANDVYNEARQRVVSAPDAEPGSVFGAEIVSEQRSVFTQFEWFPLDRWPVKTARLRLTVASGWKVTSTTFNHARIEPAVSGSSWTWEFAEAPAIGNEPNEPPRTSLVPRVVVSYFPSPPLPGLPAFSTWEDVSHWLASISDGQSTPDAALATRARELTANAADEFEKIRAIGAYVQRVTYISIQTGLGRGGGYRPHPAVEVFARNHGDCKDKANLMRAMLAAVDVRSFLVTVFAGDRDYVREAWPSPQQFNHCILAVVLTGMAPAGHAVIQAAGLGRLLIVDPTAEYTPIGTLPIAEEDSLALVETPKGGPLVRLPAAAGAHRVDRVVEATLRADGAFSASVRETSHGQPASVQRGAAAVLTGLQYQQTLERAIAQEIPAAQVSEVLQRDKDDVFELSMTVAAAGYAQLMQDRLLVFRPPFGLSRVLPAVRTAARTQPVVLQGGESSDSLRLEIPAGFVLDELPQAASIESPFGRYTLSARQDGAQVIVERSLALTRVTVPVGDYAALRAFVEQVRGADTSPVVFVRR